MKRRGKNFLPFDQAREFVRSLGLKTWREWSAYSASHLPDKGPRPADIPHKPHLAYAGKGWVDMGDWLGTGRKLNQRKNFLPFAQAREFVRSLGLKTWREWSAYSASRLPDKGPRPADIPFKPDSVYADEGWIGMGDWLGTGRKQHQRKNFRPFAEARAFARSLGLKSSIEWIAYCKGEMPQIGSLPPDIPAGPSTYYLGKGWRGFGDWLASEKTRALRFRPFNEARKFVRSLHLKCSAQWVAYLAGRLPDKGRRPPDIPSAPARAYKGKGWNGMGDWLGTGRAGHKHNCFLPFAEARAYVRKLKLKSCAEWKNYFQGRLPEKGRRPPGIPSNPDLVYAGKGWRGYPDWLGYPPR